MPPRHLHRRVCVTILAALALGSTGCGEPGTDADAGPFIPSYDPDGESCELPPACGESLQPRERPSDFPEAGTTLTVAGVDSEAEGVRVTFAGPLDRSILLPAEPLIEVGDEVSFEAERGALVLRVDGAWVAVVSSGALGDGEEERATKEAMQEVHESGTSFDLELLGVSLRLEVACGGWQGHQGWNNGCSDVPTVAFSVAGDEGPIGLGATGTVTAADGRSVVVENRGIMVDIPGGEDCLRCLESVTAICGRCGDYWAHGFRMRMVRQAPGSGRACSGLPGGCSSDAAFRVANPSAFGDLTAGDWTVSQTSSVDERFQLDLSRDEERASLDLPADPLFEEGETVTIERDTRGIAIESADGTSAVYLGPHALPGDTLELGGFTLGTVPSCGGWVEHQASPDLCPVEAAEALSITLEGVVIAEPGEISHVANANATYTFENRGVFRTVENGAPGDECAGCLDPPWGRSALLIVRTPIE